jgi:hypothetical protein
VLFISALLMKTTLASRRWGNAHQYTIVPKESKHPGESLGGRACQDGSRGLAFAAACK